MNEHDKLFKEIESIKENAIDLIEGTFPPEAVKSLDLSTMELDNTSYIDESLNEYFSDLVYNCKSKDDSNVKITILFEHKSYKPKNEYLQLLRYMLNIWTYQEKNKQDLTVIIPAIIYHGDAKWESRTFSEFFNITDDTLRSFIPDFNYLFVNVFDYDDSLIKGDLFKRKLNKALFLLYKHVKNEKMLYNILRDLFEILKSYFTDDELKEYLRSILTYIFALTEIDTNIVVKTANEITNNGGDIIMTTLMKIKNEVEDNKTTEVAKKMLEKGLNIDLIVDITNLPIEKLNELKAELDKK